MIKAYIALVILFLVVIFIYRLFFLKPRYGRMFKKSRAKNRLSISYVVLFDIYKVAKLIKKKLEKEPDTILYIRFYDVIQEFSKEQTIEEIENTLIKFQNLALRQIPFGAMYYKDTYEIMLEIWSKYSRYDDYRLYYIKALYHIYQLHEISIWDFFQMIILFCNL